MLLVSEILFNFVMSWELYPRQTYRKCFRSPSKKMWKFSMQEDKRTALISCICMGTLARSVSMPHALQVWGIVSFILA